MATSEQELEISYLSEFIDIKQISLHPFTRLSFIICNIIPITGILLFELIMILIRYKTEFSFIDIFLMSFIPGIYILFIILYFPIMISFNKKQWRSIKKLPLERYWSFSKEGIVFDKKYICTSYDWNQICKVQFKNNNIWFLLTNNLIMNAAIDALPKRALNEKQFKQLYEILLKYLDKNKVKFSA